MSDIAQLGLQIDSSSATAASAALDKLTASGQTAADAADALTASGAKSATVMSAIQAAATRAGVSYDTMNQRVDDASASSNKAATATTTHATALGKIPGAATSATSELGHLDEISAILESRMLSLGNNTGLFGQILSVLGPGGLAAAAGLGAAVVVVDELVTSANRMGDFAQQLQTMATLTGLSVTSLQTLDTVAAGFGVTSEQTGQFLERFTQQLAMLKTGSGDLYTQLLKISPALLAQMSVAKDTTTALNLLSQAYIKAGANQNALAAAAGGGSRNGAQTGLILGAVGNAGSVQALSNTVNPVDQITTDQVASWSKLDAQITTTLSDAKNNFASIFTGPVLEAEKSFADSLLSASQNAKGFVISGDLQKVIDIMKLSYQMGNAFTIGALPHVKSGGVDLSTSDIAGGMTSGVTPAPLPQFGPPAPTLAESLGVTAAGQATALSFLGSAATATDKYNESVAKLNANVANNSSLTALQSRAMDGLALTRDTAQMAGYSGALGDMPTAPASEKEEEDSDVGDERHLPKAA
jgi:hypothetical protein